MFFLIFRGWGKGPPTSAHESTLDADTSVVLRLKESKGKLVLFAIQMKYSILNIGNYNIL